SPIFCARASESRLAARMAEVTVTFEDGASERFPAGTTARDALVAHARNGGGNRKQLERAVAAHVDGPAPAVVDLSRAILRDSRVAPVSPESPAGLDVIRHSAAHLMAQ